MIPLMVELEAVPAIKSIISAQVSSGDLMIHLNTIKHSLKKMTTQLGFRI